MSESTTRKKPVYLLPIAVVVFILGTYVSYSSFGLALELVPALVSYIGIAFLLAELATGNIAIVDIREWKNIEIGVYGKLALLLMVVGEVLNSSLIN